MYVRERGWDPTFIGRVEVGGGLQGVGARSQGEGARSQGEGGRAGLINQNDLID